MLPRSAQRARAVTPGRARRSSTRARARPPVATGKCLFDASVKRAIVGLGTNDFWLSASAFADAVATLVAKMRRMSPVRCRCGGRRVECEPRADAHRRWKSFGSTSTRRATTLRPPARRSTPVRFRPPPSSPRPTGRSAPIAAAVLDDVAARDARFHVIDWKSEALRNGYSFPDDVHPSQYTLRAEFVFRQLTAGGAPSPPAAPSPSSSSSSPPSPSVPRTTCRSGSSSARVDFVAVVGACRVAADARRATRHRRRAATARGAMASLAACACRAPSA